MKKRRRLWNGKKSPAESARAVLPELAARFFATGREASREKSHDGLHRFRLAVKRFRYLLEAFKGVYGPGLEDRLARLRKIQQLLGALNDCATTTRLLKAHPDAGTPEIQQVLELVSARGAAKARASRKHWKKEFDAPGEEERWIAYLTRQAGRVRASAKA